MADNVIPIDPKKRLEASLRPAELSAAQAAVAVLAKALAIMPSIQDPPAFKAIMAKHLAPYPHDVLLRAVDQAIVNFKDMPSTHEMIELCEKLIEPRRTELRALQSGPNKPAAEPAEEIAERHRGFHERLANALGGDAPSLTDIELAETVMPSLRQAGMPITWQDFSVDDPRACADLCKRLAEIARSECADPDAIGGLIGSAAREWRLGIERRLAKVQAHPVETPVINTEPEPLARPLSEVMARLKNANPLVETDPAVEAMVEGWAKELGVEEE